MKLRIAGAQICVYDDDVSGNVRAISEAIDYAAGEQADILLTPEGALSGYHHRFDPQEVRAGLHEVTRRARLAEVGLALGVCFREDDGHCYNQLRFYEKNGDYLGFHAKTLNCGSLTDPPRGEIEYFSVKPLEVFNFQGVTIGGLICNDMWANPFCTPAPDPQLTRQLAGMGAQVIFHAVNGGRDDSELSQVATRNYHESNLRLRAAAGKVWIATVDNAFPVSMPNSCTGGIVSPEGNWAVQAPRQGEHRFVHTIEI